MKGVLLSSPSPRFRVFRANEPHADDTGVLVNREEYTPYGETSFGSFATKRYRFTGKERDEESGLYYYGARYYAPWLARWIGPDPNPDVNERGSFIYTAANPLGYVDHAGLEPQPTESSSGQTLTENKATGTQSHMTTQEQLEAKGQPIRGTEEVIKPGKGGSRIDTRTHIRSIESKAINLRAKSYRTSTGELKTSAIRSRVMRDLNQATKHMDALQQEGVVKGIKNEVTGEPLQETVVYRARGGTPEEVAAFRGIARDVARGEGVKVGVIGEPARPVQTVASNPSAGKPIGEAGPAGEVAAPELMPRVMGKVGTAINVLGVIGMFFMAVDMARMVESGELDRHMLIIHLMGQGLSVDEAIKRSQPGWKLEI